MKTENEIIAMFLEDGSDVFRMKARMHYAGIPGKQGQRIINEVIRARSITPQMVERVQ